MITMFDAIVAICFILAIISFFIFYSRKSAVVYISTVNNFQDWPEDTPPSPYWISNSVKIGDKARDSFGGERAEVVGIDSSEWGGDRSFLRLRLKVNALYNKKTRIYLLEDQPLLIGNRLSLDIGKIHYEGVISYVGTNLDDFEKDYKLAEVNFASLKVLPWIASVYSTDFEVKNTQGESIFKIISSKIEPALQQVTTSNGTMLLKRDPYLKDVYFTAKLKVRCYQGTCYFNDIYPIRVGTRYKYFSNYAFLDDHPTIVQSFKILN